ncbi:rhomboid family intramembrane serine protease [Chryseobacterium gallinarum]|uniref:rhomboid family intramembrane serine protease n=1 Tax=Chryseobacterium gallinarum TaxID=1324352 RepID=UPI0020256228|nr:rhomboid family intramembrane serine protease [Chryseobacterium gallinarum]MCL8535598.1 rhomboid family intramembrane serine protease [Chryseobacterium gallinarum]
MAGFTNKLKFIFKPFVIIATGFIITYTFLHWLLFIKAGIPLKEEILNFWLPFGLPWIPVFIWLRPRIKLLQFKNDNGSFFYQLIACIAIAIPTIIAQEYLITATGKLTQLDNISQILQHDKTKYYSIKNYYIDKEHIVVQNTATVTGKNNQNFNMLIYVAIPILENDTQVGSHNNKFWLGKKYHEQISNSLSDQEKEAKYKIFTEKSQKEFENTDFRKFTYLEVIGNTEDHDEFNNALKQLKQNSTEENLVFVAKTEPFEARNGKKLPWILGTFGMGLLVYFILLLFPKFQEKKLKKFKKGETTKNTDVKEILDLFIPKEGFYITPIIINLNLLIYIIMVFSGLGLLSFKGQNLLNWGANFKPLTTNGQWWRLLTSTFLHGGFMHIVANMYGLLFVGIFLEPLLGKVKYALIYLTTGILASFASILWYDATISVGASGAIFGLYGFFLACLVLKVFPPDFGKAFLISTLVFVGVNLLMGLAGGIDNAAHIGGLISGFIIGVIMSGQIKKQIKLSTEYENEE